MPLFFQHAVFAMPIIFADAMPLFSPTLSLLHAFSAGRRHFR